MGKQRRIRIVTAAALFDGHDAAINIMRRILQSKGVEVIHLGHNRSAFDVVNAAIQEDAQAIAITSYQGGHIEFFKYLYDLLHDSGATHIRIFGGGGGTILPEEIKILQDYGIERLYTPEDGMKLGLNGMIEDLLSRCNELDDSGMEKNPSLDLLGSGDSWLSLSKAITLVENDFSGQRSFRIDRSVRKPIPVIGVTGPGGAGKSSLLDELVRLLFSTFTDIRVGVISIDPTLKKTGGALLGDRIRFNSTSSPNLYFRSVATRGAGEALYVKIQDIIAVCKSSDLDILFVETPGIGQSDCGLVDITDLQLYVMTPDYGAPSQLEKINMLDYAGLIAVNKSDRTGAEDALADVKRQYRRNHQLWDRPDSDFPIYATNASHFRDPGVAKLFDSLMRMLQESGYHPFSEFESGSDAPGPLPLKGIPADRMHYLMEIVKELKSSKGIMMQQADWARQRQSLQRILDWDEFREDPMLIRRMEEVEKQLRPSSRMLIQDFYSMRHQYMADNLTYSIQGRTFSKSLKFASLSGISLSRIAVPNLTDEGDILIWMMQENFPGYYPFTAGVYPLKNDIEDPTRMFAGEGTPERTNQRFHLLSRNLKAKRLSTAFDSVTLYGENPAIRPDIFGKIGNSGVSIATLDDIKKLYAGFDLTDPLTSVSMTINGPAPMMLAYFLNAAIDQACELYIRSNGMLDQVMDYKRKKFSGHPIPVYVGSSNQSEIGLLLLGMTGNEVLDTQVYERIRSETFNKVRGTVQADILKEDQAQNTCIFSTEFALHLMGDIQEYFSLHNINKFYSISISGYHIAEAGANPITQLAFTLANGFTYIEYFLSRGLPIDDFAPNLSFFFSNGLDPEYAVIGRVARRIWARTLRNVYGASERSQKLKYHIQTSGRSLHAQEMEFNDIRTTLQALYAIYDNCNSLHTNAYDEALTTPTEQSVRRALAIQLIINKEFGFTKTDNALQGSFLITELTDLVEEAVYMEFQRISERGGVLGAMERMYQRNKIQEESMVYESLKSKGELPIIGVNTFVAQEHFSNKRGLAVSRSTEMEKHQQIEHLRQFEQLHSSNAAFWLLKMETGIGQGTNSFELLMEAAKYCSLGQLTQLFYKIGGRYRRSM